MGKYIGPKSKIARRFGEAIYGADKVLEKRNVPPGQHGLARKRKKVSEYGTQLTEKQKAKYTYGVLEKQFRNLFPLGDNQFRRRRRGGGPQVRCKVTEGKIGFMAYGGNNGDRAGRHGPDQGFVVKRPQILQGAAAPPNNNNVANTRPAQGL